MAIDVGLVVVVAVVGRTARTAVILVVDMSVNNSHAACSIGCGTRGIYGIRGQV